MATDPKPFSWLEPSALARLMAQPLVTGLPMEGTISGHHKSPHRGSSVEFAEYRNYVPGDDIRRLDWRVFAKTDRFYMKEFEAETNLRAYLVLDCSGSMAFTGLGRNKFDFARQLIATLAYLIIHQGDAVGLLCVGEKGFREIPARRNPSHLHLILETLDSLRPSGETGLIPALHEMAEKIRPRAVVSIFSDFFCEIDGLLSCFQHLRYKKHDLAAFQLLDQMEIDFQFDRPIRFTDLEGSFSLVTEPTVIREEYQRQLQIFLERFRTGCHEFKADYRRVLTDANYEKVLSDFLVQRAQHADRPVI